ncbi:MAG: hypothetical protein LBC41_05805 [Clostridiales bacterium]|jgi:actin-related protein|nr:hypothetical protein [Clostridiales bacterium]
MKVESFTDYVEELVRETAKERKQKIQQREKIVKSNIVHAKIFYENGTDVKLVESQFGLPEWLIKKIIGATADESYDEYLCFLFTEAQSMLANGDSIDAVKDRTELSDEAIELSKSKLPSKLADEVLRELKESVEIKLVSKVDGEVLQEFKKVAWH